LDVAFGVLWPEDAVVEVVSGMILLHRPELMMLRVMMSVQMMMLPGWNGMTNLVRSLLFPPTALF
jgi:hypothetical protein